MEVRRIALINIGSTIFVAFVFVLLPANAMKIHVICLQSSVREQPNRCNNVLTLHV